jgi:dTDP-4-dehydrorhamnose reductase
MISEQKTSLKRVVVTGREGQVVRSLLERGALGERFEVIALGRPDLDLSVPDTIDAPLRAARPDVIVSAAAYTAVDLAESEEQAATTINGIAAGMVAATAADLGVPVIHLSTDYVFDGSKQSPYIETDPVVPLGAYGRSKLVGELAVATANADHAILRTAWIYSPFGKNFLKTMLGAAETRSSLNVVDDQLGNPTSALDIADAVLSVAENLLTSNDLALRGVFHMTGSGDATWADFAAGIFSRSAELGGPSAIVNRIQSAQYPTPAKRPANSRLNCGLLAARHGLKLPDWQQSMANIVERLART